MATTTTATCLRVATRSHQALRSQTFRHARRTLATSPRLHAKQPPPSATPIFRPAQQPSPSTNQPPPPKSDYKKLSAWNAPSPAASAAIALRNAAPRSATEPYLAYGGTEDLFAECARQADYTVPQALMEPPQPAPQNAAGDHLGVGQGWWLEPKSAGGLGLDVTFNAWAQVCMLHMYILTVRIRAFPKDVAGQWHQQLTDHFFYAAEDKMAMWHGMTSRHIRNKNLKLLYEQWRGVQLSYDEGLVKGDAVMGTAIWRNLMKGSERVDISDLARITGFIRRELQKLGRVEDELICEGQVRFGRPQEIEVEGSANLLGKTFTGEDLAALMEAKAGGAEKR